MSNYRCKKLLAATKEELKLWDDMRETGCVICGGCDVEIHHIETGAGGRKNHSRVIPLCVNHHRGPDGIHFLGRKNFRNLNGAEQDLFKVAVSRVEIHREKVKLV